MQQMRQRRKTLKKIDAAAYFPQKYTLAPRVHPASSMR
jgi:hypothetical protein